MEEELETNDYLKKLYTESESKVKTCAMVQRAYIGKMSSDKINDKVNAQMNSIKTSIYSINPKFKEGSKNYDSIKQNVLDSLANYEQALIELSEFYDVKIEQLILRKVELEASLVGAILNEEYLSEKLIRKNEQKECDKVKKSIKDNLMQALERIKFKKKENNFVDLGDVSKAIDGQDIAFELEDKLDARIEKTTQDKKDNQEFISKIEKELLMIKAEIERLNDRKIQLISDAMEVGGKTITTNIKKPKVFSKLTKFLVSRFNAAKIIESTVIIPLNLRIENFRNNELADKKG